MEEDRFNCMAYSINRAGVSDNEGSSDLFLTLKGFEDDFAKKEMLIRQKLATLQNQSSYNIKLLFEQFYSLVMKEKVISARFLCEQLLVNEQLTPENKYIWIETFLIIKKLLQNVDYKGVREVLKICREKAAKCFSNDLCSDELVQINVLVDVLKYIFDRSACLLPAYFIITEIQKCETFEMHWQVNRLISTCIEEFTYVAQMLSIILLPKLLPVVEHGDHMINSWRLDPITLKFNLKGALPYCNHLTEPQTKLLRFVLEQPYSRDFVCSMLNLQKNQRVANVQLEKNLIWLILSAMERSELSNSVLEEAIPSYWLHLSSQVIYFVLFQYATFPNIINALHTALTVKKYRKGRNQLMWVLLQFISGSIQRNPIQNFLPVLDLFDLLYPEKEPLPVPDITKSSCAQMMAPTCIWIHISRKSKLDNFNMSWSLPLAFKLQYDYLQQLANNTTILSSNNYAIPLLCNAFSTNQDYFARPMAVLIDTILGTKPSTNSNCLSMSILDSLTVHSKMSLIHSIVTHLIGQSKSTLPNAISPGLMETYSRLLVYTEIESLGIKGFLGQLLPAVIKSQAWGVLFTLLEMFSYRINFHVPPNYKIQLVSHLNTIGALNHSMQLHLCIETTSLRLINGLTSFEITAQMSRFYSGEQRSMGSVVSSENEETNRVLMLTLARSINNTNGGYDKSSLSWCKDMLNHISQCTPHTWSPYTFQCFPSCIKEIVGQNIIPRDNIKTAVDEEYRKWTSLANESEALSKGSNSQLLLCLAFKMLLETDNINKYILKTIERIDTKTITSSLRRLCDYIILEITAFSTNGSATKCIECINKMIWNYSMFSIDTFIIKLVFRPYDNNEAQICFYIIQSLLLKPQFINRLLDFVSENSPEYWKHNNIDKNIQFHQKYDEKFMPDEITTPVSFGNVCLRVLPVLDVFIHRLIEFLSNQTNVLDNILDNFGCLYKYHEQPISFLYNTLYYYERNLQNYPSIKRKLVNSIGAQLFPSSFLTLENYKKQFNLVEAEDTFILEEPSFYTEIVKEVLDAIEGQQDQSSIDWRFNEFPNQPTFSLYVTCIEILCLPQAPSTTTHKIMDIIVKRYGNIAPGKIHSWINAIGLIIARLPEPYFRTVFNRLHDLITSSKLSEWKYRHSPFTMFNFDMVYGSMLDKTFVNFLAIAHALIQHFNIGQMGIMIEFIRNILKPEIKTEEQMIFLCHVICPFLNRLEAELSRAAMDITIILYEVLEQVDKANIGRTLIHIDPICDLLYHLKYMYIGDTLKCEIEAIIKKLSSPLRTRLRFITNLNVVVTDKLQDMGNKN